LAIFFNNPLSNLPFKHLPPNTGNGGKACSLGTHKAEIRGSGVQGQSGLCSKILSQKTFKKSIPMKNWIKYEKSFLIVLYTLIFII
jgi:hypothetical protein